MNLFSTFHNVGKQTLLETKMLHIVSPACLAGLFAWRKMIENDKIYWAILHRKLKRILAWENAKPNYYRQHITDIKNYLMKEIKEEAKKLQYNMYEPYNGTGLFYSNIRSHSCVISLTLPQDIVYNISKVSGQAVQIIFEPVLNFHVRKKESGEINHGKQKHL